MRNVGLPPGGDSTARSADRVIGRTDELTVLADALTRAAAGSGAVALVVGDAGIGKSSLLHAFATAAARHALVLQVSGDEDETDIGFGLVDQWAVQASKATGTRWERTRGVLDPLAIGAELLDEWSALAAEHPLVIMVDDAGVADQPSLRAMAFALRRLAHDPVLAVFACRREFVGDLPDGLVRLADSDRGAHIELNGLSGPAFGSLLRSATNVRLSGDQIERVHEHTAGNPLHALALARELGPDLFAGDPLGPLPAPRSIAALVHARVAALSADASALLTGAAVLGVKCPLRVVGEIANVVDPARALAEAEAAGIVVVRSDATGPVIRFDHPLTRSAIYHDLDPLLVAAYHARAAIHVSNPIDALRHRVAACPSEDDDLASDAERLGRELAGTGAWFTAAGWLDSAAAISTTAADRERRTVTADMYRVYGGTPWPAPSAGAPNGHESPERLVFVGASLVVASQLVEGEALLRQAWARIDPQHNVDLAVRLAVRMSDALNAQLRSAEASEWAARAYHLIPEGEVVPGEDPLSDWLYGLVTSGHLDEALATAAREVPPRGSRAVGLLGRGIVRVVSDDLVGSIDDLRASLGYFKRVGPAHKRLESELALVEAHYRLGEWDRALQCGASAHALADDLEITMLLGAVLATLAGLVAGQGRFDAAEELLEAAQDALILKGSYQATGLLFLARARVAAARGDDAGVIDVLTTLEAVARAFPQADEQVLVPWRLLLGTALAHMGEHDAARDHADRLTDQAARSEVVSLRAGGARLRGLVAAGLVDLEAAIGALTDSAGLYGGIPMPFEAALSEYELGCVLVGAGDRTAARPHLTSAAATFGRIGATPYQQRALAALEGDPPAAPTRSDPVPVAVILHDLTPSEAAVARLVAEGKSNREAAAALVVSVRTVEHHLGRVYAKLALSSRTQLTALLAGVPRQYP